MNCKVAGKVYCAQKIIIIAHSKAADKVHIAQSMVLFASMAVNPDWSVALFEAVRRHVLAQLVLGQR